MSASRAKGTGAETAVVRYLRVQGWPHAERRALGGNSDRGDIAGVIGTVIEVKNCRRLELAEWVDEAERERHNDNADLGVVWHKRRGRGSPGDWFVTMDGATFTWLLAAAQGLEQPRLGAAVAQLSTAVKTAADFERANQNLAARLASDHATVLNELDNAQQEVRRG